MANVNVAQLMVQVSADTSEATAALGSLGTMLAKTGPIAIGAVLVGAAVAAIGVASLKMAGDFQAGTTTLVTGAGLAGSSLDKVRNSILQMAVDTGTSTKQLTDGMFMISSAFSSTGMSAANQLKILQAAAEGAKVGGADLGTTADAVTTIMKDYGLGANQASTATNLLIATVADGKTHMQDLADSISTVLPTASKFGVSLGDVMGAMATMTSHGIAAANAATYLRQMIVSLEAPTSTGVKALASVGLTAQEVTDEIKNHGLPAALDMITTAIGKTFPAGSTQALTAFKDIAGGSRQMQGMLALTGSTAKEFATDAANLGGVAGSTSTQITGWGRVQDTFNQQLSRAKEAAEVLMIELGQHLIPVATQLMNMLANGLIPTVQNFITFITGTSQQAEALRPILAVLAIAIGGALVAAFGAWTVTAIAAAAATLAATWEVLAVGAAIAVLVAGIIWAYQNWGWFRDAVNAVKTVLGDILGFIGSNVLPILGKLASITGTDVGNSFKILGNAISEVKSLFQDLMNIGNAVIGVFNNVKNAIGNAASAAGNAVGGVLSHIPGFATGGVMPTTGLAVVGEQGPELVQLPGSTQITPLSGSNAISGPPSNVFGAMTGGSAGANNAPMQINLQIDGRKLAQIVTQYQPGIVRNATGIRSV